MQEMTLLEPEQPDVAAACMAAILAPALATGATTVCVFIWVGFTSLFIGFVAFIFALIIAALHVLVLGLPGYLLVRRFVVPDWRLSAFAGVLLGAAPVFLLSDAWKGDDLTPTLIFGGMGLIGGLGFQWKLSS